MTEELSAAGENQRIKDVPRNLKPYFLGFLIKGEQWNDNEVHRQQPEQMAAIECIAHLAPRQSQPHAK